MLKVNATTINEAEDESGNIPAFYEDFKASTVENVATKLMLVNTFIHEFCFPKNLFLAHSLMLHYTIFFIIFLIQVVHEITSWMIERYDAFEARQ